MFCYFCQKNINDVDYKNTELLSRFISINFDFKPSETSVAPGLPAPFSTTSLNTALGMTNFSYRAGR